MMYYETLLLLDANASQADIEAVEEQVKALLKKSEGSLTSFNKWGKYRLAYPIRKKEHGIYALARYEVGVEHDAFFKKIDIHFRVKLPDLVMRHVHVKLTEEEFKAEYVKPESIEEAGERPERGDRRRGGPRSGAPSREAKSSAKTEVAAKEAPATEAQEVATQEAPAPVVDASEKAEG